MRCIVVTSSPQHPRLWLREHHHWWRGQSLEAALAWPTDSASCYGSKAQNDCGQAQAAADLGPSAESQPVACMPALSSWCDEYTAGLMETEAVQNDL